MKKRLLLLLLIVSTLSFSQNYISTNNSFQKGLDGWDYGVTNSTDLRDNYPEADFEVVKDFVSQEPVLKVKVKVSTKSENPNDVYLLRRGLKLKKGKKYRINFSIKSTANDDQFLASIGSGYVENFKSLMKRPMKFKGNNEWQKVSFTLQVDKNNPRIDYKDLCLVIGFNHRFGSFYLKDFVIKDLNNKSYFASTE